MSVRLVMSMAWDTPPSERSTWLASGKRTSSLISPYYWREGIFAQVTRVRLSVVYKLSGALDLVGERQQVGVKPRKSRIGVSAAG